MIPLRKSLPRPLILRSNHSFFQPLSPPLSNDVARSSFSSSFKQQNPTSYLAFLLYPSRVMGTKLFSVCNETNDAFYANSWKKLKPTLRFLFSDSQTGCFSTTKPRFLIEPIMSTHLSKLSTQPKTPFKISFSDRIPSYFMQTRYFSSENVTPQNGMSISPTLESSVPIDAGSSIRKPISLWPGMYHSPVTNALWEARSSIFEKPTDSLDGNSHSELVTKSPSKSRTSIVYNFSSDFVLKEQYRNPWNEIRMGKLVEDLDALAGTISYKHCCNEDGITRPLLLVTASVDKMVLKKPIRVDADLKIVGAVTWVGRSSMEIQLEVIQSTEEPAIRTMTRSTINLEGRVGEIEEQLRAMQEKLQTFDKEEILEELKREREELKKDAIENRRLLLEEFRSIIGVQGAERHRTGMGEEAVAGEHHPLLFGGKEEAKGQKVQLYKSLSFPVSSTQEEQHHGQPPLPALGGSVLTEQPFAYGNQGADLTPDLSNKPLEFASSISHDHDPHMQSSYTAYHDSAGNGRALGLVAPLPCINSWTPVATGFVYPANPPGLLSRPQHDPITTIPSPVAGHVTPPFRSFHGTSFQPIIPSAGMSYDIGPGFALHPTAGFPSDAYGVSNVSEQSKKEKAKENANERRKRPKRRKRGRKKRTGKRKREKRRRRNVKRKKGRRITQGLIKWQHLPEEEATWEDKIFITAQFPYFKSSWGQEDLHGEGIVTYQRKGKN